MPISYPSSHFNRFDPAKNYKNLVFLSGSGLQAAELNEIQDGILYQLKKISRFLINNGTILSGCEVVSSTLTSLSIAAGSVYAEGFTIQVPARAVPITGVGIELVGMAASEALITDVDDPTLREPDALSPNYGQPGAYRLANTGTWKVASEVTGTETFFPIFTLNNGVIVASSANSLDSSTLFQDLLSAYDYETRGNYLFYGLGVSYKSMDGTTKAITVNVASGKARVTGIPVVNPVTKPVELLPLTDTRDVAGEPYVYAGSIDYDLRYAPMSAITRVQGTKETSSIITHGILGSSDALPSTPVLSIVAVNQGGTWGGSSFTGGTTYVPTTDYIQSGDSVSWSPGGAEPAQGSTYTVVYRYISNFVPTMQTDLSGITLDGSNILVTGTAFSVDYSYYLKRIDRVNLAADGSIVVTKGTPGYNFYAPPDRKPHLLSLATVDMTYGVAPPTITTDTTVNMKMDDLKVMQSNIDDLKLNVAMLALYNDAVLVDPTTTKRNLVVDSLSNTVMEDLGSTNTLAIVDKQLHLPSVFTAATTSTGFKLLPYTTTLSLDQPLKTGARKINPFALNTNPLTAAVVLSPSVIFGERWWFDVDRTTTAASSTVAFTGSRFTAGENVSVVYNGGAPSTVVANGSGVCTGTITVPSGTLAGSYSVILTGATSGAVARAAITVRISVHEQPPVPPPSPIPVPPRERTVSRPGGETFMGVRVNTGVDPVAQTFTVESDQQLASVLIEIAELPTDDILVRIVPVSLGLPDSSIYISQGRLLREAVIIGQNTATLERPITLYSGIEYAVVILTNKPMGTVSTARIGGYDSNTSKWVLAQPTDGVLLISANNSTWSPVQDEDLTYKLYAANYTTLDQTITVMSLPGQVATTDWLLTGNYEIPPNTSATFFIDIGGGTVYEIAWGKLLTTAAFTGTATLTCKLKTSDPKFSPIIGDVTVQTGTVLSSGSYTQRAFTVTNGSVTPFSAKIIIKEFKPSGTTIAPAIETSAGVFTNATFSSAVALGDGWNESTYTISGVAMNTSRVRITIGTSVPTVRPKVASIRLLIS